MSSPSFGQNWVKWTPGKPDEQTSMKAEIMGKTDRMGRLEFEQSLRSLENRVAFWHGMASLKRVRKKG